jgi:hypothetical protein
MAHAHHRRLNAPALRQQLVRFSEHHLLLPTPRLATQHSDLHGLARSGATIAFHSAIIRPLLLLPCTCSSHPTQALIMRAGTIIGAEGEGQNGIDRAVVGRFDARLGSVCEEQHPRSAPKDPIRPRCGK